MAALDNLGFYQMIEEEGLMGYSSHYNRIDCEVAEEIPCPECGHKLHYRGYKKDDSYRAFTVCNFCEYFAEF